MYDELERAAQAGDADRAARVFADMKERYRRAPPSPSRAACSPPRSQFEKGKADAAAPASPGSPTTRPTTSTRPIARLRLAGLLLDAKEYDEALKQLDGADREGIRARWSADRRGDVLLAQGKKDEAQGRLREGLDGDGPDGRLPAPGRGQADRARRRAGGCRGRRGERAKP